MVFARFRLNAALPSQQRMRPGQSRAVKPRAANPTYPEIIDVSGTRQSLQQPKLPHLRADPPQAVVVSPVFSWSVANEKN